MPTERLSMRRIRELLRLKYENGLSSRVIAGSLGISKGSVGDYLRRTQVAGLGWPLPETMSDTALERRLFPGQPPASAKDHGPEPDWGHIDRELRRPGVTRALLWQEYRTEHPSGYGYSWFCEHYEAWKQRLSPTVGRRDFFGLRRHPDLREAAFRFCVDDRALTKRGEWHGPARSGGPNGD